jgi:hypothetical protein
MVVLAVVVLAVVVQVQEQEFLVKVLLAVLV